MNPETLELTPETTALAVRSEPSLLPGKAAETAPKTAQQMRVVEVTEALAPAYAKASTLDLTEKEVADLIAPFPDDAVEVRPHDGLIYIPHIFISDRLNRVFGPGKWAMICRRHWLEGQTMYGEYVMLIRGCYVGESVGGHPYQPNNPKTNYSDTLESTAAEALRRIAGKRLSCGSQVWQPEYARQWVSKYATQSGGKWHKRAFAPAPTTKPAPEPPRAAPESGEDASFETAEPKTPPPPKTPPKPSQSHLSRLVEILKPLGQAPQEYCEKAGMLLPTETLSDLPLGYVPATKEQADAFMSCVQSFVDGGEAVKPPYYNDPEGKPTKAPLENPFKHVEGVPQAVTSKEGTSSKGKYTKYGVKLADGWLNTFDAKIGQACEDAKAAGRSVKLSYKDTKFGREIVGCE